MKSIVEKDEHYCLIRQLPSHAPDDDLLREMYVWKVIEEDLLDSKARATKGNL